MSERRVAGAQREVPISTLSPCQFCGTTPTSQGWLHQGWCPVLSALLDDEDPED